MTFEIYATKRFQKEFNKLGEKVRGRIRKRVAELKENPYLGVPLTAQFKGKYKLRIGDYRVIYEIEFQNSRIFLVAVGPRKNVYDREKQ